MAKSASSPPWQRAMVTLSATVVGVVVVALLYWVQVVFIPLALAVFTFMLGPPMLALQRRGLGRIPSVALVVGAAALVFSLIGYVVVVQVSHLVAELPRHTEVIKRKIKAVREMAQAQTSSRLGWMVHEITGELSTKSNGEADDTATANGDTPLDKQLIIVQSDGSGWLKQLPMRLTGALEPLAAVGLAIVLSIFMLLKREDLRNRFISLAGHGQMTVTTRAVDDASARISRYLMMQVLINGGYGLAWGIGLRIIGVDYALLWGFLAGLARYVPYIGTPSMSMLPVAMSLIMFDGWIHVILVLALLIFLELVTTNLIEPHFYGQSIGVSEVALLLAAALWAFLWGPIGLVLSGPLTVCLVVMGRYIPQLEFFAVALGDEPALEPRVAYYQRLLAGDKEEAKHLARKRAKTSSPEQVYDEILVPSLNLAKRDFQRKLLTVEEEKFVLSATSEIIEDLAEEQEATATKEASANGLPAGTKKILIMGWGACDEVDRLGLDMMRHMFDPRRWEVEIAPCGMLVAQLVALAEEKRPAVFCIASLPPGGVSHTRYLVKRLRRRLPHVKIVIGRWGQQGNFEAMRQEFLDVGADLVESNLVQTRNELVAWLPVLEQGPDAATAATPAKQTGPPSHTVAI